MPNYLDLGWLDHAREAYDTSGPRPRLANAGDRTTFFLFNGFTKCVAMNCTADRSPYESRLRCSKHSSTESACACLIPVSLGMWPPVCKGLQQGRRHAQPTMLLNRAVLACPLQTAFVLDREDMSYSGGVRQGLLAMFAKTTRPNVKINKGESGR